MTNNVELINTAGMNIYQKLAAVRKQIQVIERNKAGYGYRYVSEDEILARVSVLLDRYNLLLIPSIVSETGKVIPYSTMKTRTTKGGEIYEEHVNEILVSGDMYWSWIDVDNPESKLSIPWFLVGQQSDASQAMGAGLTYTSRYFLLKFFNIATPDSDPDAFRSKQKEAEAAADKTVADEIIKTFDTLIRDYLSANSGKSDAVKAVVTKYVKSGDYSKINDPALAARLLNEFKETFLKEE